MARRRRRRTDMESLVWTGTALVLGWWVYRAWSQAGSLEALWASWMTPPALAAPPEEESPA